MYNVQLKKKKQTKKEKLLLEKPVTFMIIRYLSKDKMT